MKLKILNLPVDEAMLLNVALEALCKKVIVKRHAQAPHARSRRALLAPDASRYRDLSYPDRRAQTASGWLIELPSKEMNHLSGLK